MSYSFSVRGATRAEVRFLIKAELNRVVEQQPVHAADRADAEEVANTFISLVPEDGESDFQVSMHGSVGSIDGALVSASMGVSVTKLARL